MYVYVYYIREMLLFACLLLMLRKFFCGFGEKKKI